MNLLKPFTYVIRLVTVLPQVFKVSGLFMGINGEPTDREGGRDWWYPGPLVTGTKTTKVF